MPLNTDSFSKPALARMRAAMRRHVEAGEMPGLVYALSRRGETVVETVGSQAVGGKPMQADTIFRIASMSKPILAVAAMTLVEDCVLRLDEPVDRWLPELANRRVLCSRESAIDDTVAAKRAITLRDVLTNGLGLGVVTEQPSRYPFQRAMDEAGVAPGPSPYTMGYGDFMAGLAKLPLLHQPGEGWTYQTGYDVLGILLARATGKRLGTLLDERIFRPLGMKDTGFFVPHDRLDRFATQYRRNGAGLEIEDEARTGWYSGPLPFERAGAELVSTAPDLLRFHGMMLNGGTLDGARIVSRASVRLMTADQTTEAQKEWPDARFFIGAHRGWGFQVGVDLKQVSLGTNAGRFGWDGGYGTSAWCDPAEDLTAILLTQRTMDSPQPQKHYLDFWTSAYAVVGE